MTQNVALPEGQKFSDLSIDDETQLLAVSSHKNGSSKLDVLMLFALYDIFPQLVFRQLLEVLNLEMNWMEIMISIESWYLVIQIKRSVFGNSVTGAEISQGILITLHRGNLIRSYSLNDACSFEVTDFLSISTNDNLVFNFLAYRLTSALRNYKLQSHN